MSITFRSLCWIDRKSLKKRGFLEQGQTQDLQEAHPGMSLKTFIRVRVPIRVRPAFLISESETHCAHG